MKFVTGILVTVGVAAVLTFLQTVISFAGSATDATIAATAPQEYSSQAISGDFDKSDAKQFDKAGKLTWEGKNLVGPGYAFPTDDKLLGQEAKAFGISQDEVSNYVMEVKAMNAAYTAGGLTKTEYAQKKRELLSLLK